ncbi:asparagine--tRNA ligase [Pelagicoccus sp. SDUM812003]|uniref:asparagine--tRNA ligase n=1 Tax=Pelagicoccus sp. SDUM812003 TaxID=3041267 RepID=UPI00280E0B1F|nr:asparagine--tRNA ligase [Pelagicoccus sp. SDUM812003]MDQ8203817.1 asparagine--tRNA ligase [Pelagicoccus sp. SDUM812003]
MTRQLVVDLLASESEREEVLVKGWVRTRRDSKTFFFLEINDGSSLKSLQIVVNEGVPGYDESKGITTGAAVSVKGRLVASQGKGQSWEVQAVELQLIGAADDSFPLQKKRHSNEYLREIAHLRPRTNLFGAVFRIRSKLAFAIHRFFQDRKFFYVHTPIVTASDCEGAGELFRVTTLDTENPPRGEDGKIDYSQDFFGKSTYLTVSGQLEGETYATALGNIYTFGPTFRAENSHTSRHASEFWMVEPEMAFCDLQEDMTLAEDFVKSVIAEVMESCSADLELFFNFVDKELKQRLEFVVSRPFKRLPYTEAIELLQSSGKTFEHPVQWGVNLQSEHERYLTEEHFKCPVTVYDYPKTLKPFYMRANDDGKTVAAMDVLVPGIGEIVGGSQREERLELLLENMKQHGISEDDYWWYVDLRRYGSVPHAGFGLGFERLLMFVTGVTNIRDVIPFPRVPGHAEF